MDEIKCLKVCSNIFDDNRVDDEDVDDVDYSESMHWCNFEPVHHLINNKQQGVFQPL